MTYLEPQKWELPPVPRNFWKDRDNRLNYILWLGEKLNFNSEDDLNEKIKTVDFQQVSKLMGSFNEIRERSIKEKWERLLQSI